MLTGQHIPGLQMLASSDFACQTDKETFSVGIQLLLKTLGTSYRSAGMEPPLLGYIYKQKDSQGCS